MSFFLSIPPASVRHEFEKPQDSQQAEAGSIYTRRLGTVFWSGRIDFTAQIDDPTVLGELDRASARGNTFWARLYDYSGAPPIEEWIPITNPATDQIVSSDARLANLRPGSILSFRSSLAPVYVSARIVKAVSESGGTRTITFSTPIPREYIQDIANVTFSVCANAPHVTARIRDNSVQWTTQPRRMNPSSVSWYETTDAALYLEIAARDPVPPGQPGPFQRLLINERGTSYLSAEDGTILSTEL